MAEALGLAASIAGIAGVGVSVVSTLTQFGISYRGSNDKINSLAGRVSLTVSILSDIQTTVEANASGFKKEEFWNTWRQVLGSCEHSYERLEKGLSKARSWGSVERRGAPKVSVWGKLVWALGGEGEMRDLEGTLERCCQQVMMMQQAVQMSVLSLISQRQNPSTEEIDDQQEITGKLQWLLSALSEAGIFPVGKSESTPIIIIDDEKSNTKGDISQGEDFLATSESPSLTRGLDNGVEIKAFATNNNLPNPSVLPSEVQKSPTTSWKESKDYFFEAYYIIPRSLPRAQHRGQIQLCKPAPDDHMIICLDTKRDYRQDPNLREALRRAKRSAGVKMNAESFPASVRDATMALANLRERHVKGLTCALVESLELQCSEDSSGIFRKSSAKTGFLVIFRGSVLKLEDQSLWEAQKDIPVDRTSEAEFEFLQKEKLSNGKAIYREKMKNRATSELIQKLHSDKKAPDDTQPANGPPEGLTNISPVRPLSPEHRVDPVPAPAPAPPVSSLRPLSADPATGEKKKKCRVSFDATADRPASRSLPGPIQYESARSRLIGNNVQSAPYISTPPAPLSYTYAPPPENWFGIPAAGTLPSVIPFSASRPSSSGSQRSVTSHRSGRRRLGLPPFLPPASYTNRAWTQHQPLIPPRTSFLSQSWGRVQQAPLSQMPPRTEGSMAQHNGPTRRRKKKTESSKGILSRLAPSRRITRHGEDMIVHDRRKGSKRESGKRNRSTGNGRKSYNGESDDVAVIEEHPSPRGAKETRPLSSQRGGTYRTSERDAQPTGLSASSTALDINGNEKGLEGDDGGGRVLKKSAKSYSASPSEVEPTFASKNGGRRSERDDQGRSVPNERAGNKEELHLSQDQAKAMMMEFLATFTVV